MMTDSSSGKVIHTPSILASFEEDLPLLNRSTTVVYKTATPSGETTKACKPPLVLLCHSPKYSNGFIDLANSTLRQFSEGDFDNRRLPPPFPEYALDTEAELGTAAETQILQPIFEILHQRWGRKYKIRKESHPEIAGTSDCTVRFDLVFSTGDDKNETIMVLEFKRREMIRYDDFAQLRQPKGPSGLMEYGSSDEAVKKRMAAIKKTKTGSPWGGNAVPYLRQISKYAKKSSCPYVALFNWDHLLLFKFDKEKLGVEGLDDEATAGNVAELTWVSEHNAIRNKESGNFIQRHKIRKALLGFIIVAFEAKLD